MLLMFAEEEEAGDVDGWRVNADAEEGKPDMALRLSLSKTPVTIKIFFLESSNNITNIQNSVLELFSAQWQTKRHTRRPSSQSIRFSQSTLAVASRSTKPGAFLRRLSRKMLS
jgi:hypothetical protein